MKCTVILGHFKPDMDCICSQLEISQIVPIKYRDTYIVSNSEDRLNSVSKMVKHLPDYIHCIEPKRINKNLSSYDEITLFVVDCHTEDRIEGLQEILASNYIDKVTSIIILDHHLHKSTEWTHKFPNAKVDITIDTDCPSAVYLIHKKYRKNPLDHIFISEYVILGTASDTLCFKIGNKDDELYKTLESIYNKYKNYYSDRLSNLVTLEDKFLAREIVKQGMLTKYDDYFVFELSSYLYTKDFNIAVEATHLAVNKYDSDTNIAIVNWTAEDDEFKYVSIRTSEDCSFRALDVLDTIPDIIGGGHPNACGGKLPKV